MTLVIALQEGGPKFRYRIRWLLQACQPPRNVGEVADGVADRCVLEVEQCHSVGAKSAVTRPGISMADGSPPGICGPTAINQSAAVAVTGEIWSTSDLRDDLTVNDQLARPCRRRRRRTHAHYEASLAPVRTDAARRLTRRREFPARRPLLFQNNVHRPTRRRLLHAGHPERAL